MNGLVRVLKRIVVPTTLACLGALLSGCAGLKPQPFTFVQLCDPQIGFGDYQADLSRLERAIAQVNTRRPDFVVICGDLVNRPDEKSFRDFQAARRTLEAPSYCAPGNHDLGNAPTLQSLSNYRRLIGKDYLSFSHKGSVFIVLNTQLWRAPIAGETERQEAWMYKTLEAAARMNRPVFVVLHYPPFVKTADEPTEYFNIPLQKRRELLAAFERYGVVAILAGHTHTTTFHTYSNTQIVTSETTSKNFDKRPFGFRLWTVSPGGTFHHEFEALKEQD